MKVAVNTLVSLLIFLQQQKKGTKSKVKERRAKLAMKIILRGTSANKEGHDGTGLRGCPIEALYVIVVWPYKWEERFFHRLNFNNKKRS